MNNNYDFNSKKYVLLLFIVCTLFLILTIKAFDYLPVETPQQKINVETINTPAQSSVRVPTEGESKEEKIKDEDSDRHKSGHIDFMKKENSTYNESDKFEEIEAPKGIIEEDFSAENSTEKTNTNIQTLSKNEQALKSIINGQKYKANSDYTNALKEFQKVSELTNDKELNAMSCENIAEIYAKLKKYGTALSFAGKAYQLAPSSAREMLIARIYYNAGNTDTAITRMNNLLKRGF